VHSPAQYNLGVMYENGWGIPHDAETAVRWYRKAADQGVPTPKITSG
jgi:TPR repeat protein